MSKLRKDIKPLYIWKSHRAKDDAYAYLLYDGDGIGYWIYTTVDVALRFAAIYKLEFKSLLHYRSLVNG